MNQAEANYFASMIYAYILDMYDHESAAHVTVINAEIACVVAEFGGGFQNIR